MTAYVLNYCELETCRTHGCYGSLQQAWDAMLLDLRNGEGELHRELGQPRTGRMFVWGGVAYEILPFDLVPDPA